MSEIRYVCSGGCGLMIPVEKYKKGQKTCGEKSCDHYGKPLERVEYCASCNTSFEEGDGHICQ